MRWAVLGASGHTGRNVVAKLIRRDQEVVGIARHASDALHAHSGLTRLDIDILDASGIRHALDGVDAVLSAVGIGGSRSPTTIYSEGIRNVTAAMEATGAEHLVVLSAAPLGPREAAGWMDRSVVMPILDRVFGATYADMRRMEAQLATSSLSWVCLRPPRLVDKPAKGAYRVSVDVPLPRARNITFADLAAAMITSVSQPDLQRSFVHVSN